MLKLIFISFVLSFVACLNVDDEEGSVRQDTNDHDTYNTQLTYCGQGGWWCSNGGTCEARQCVVVPASQLLAIRCNATVDMIFWGNRFPGDLLESHRVTANMLVSATTATTAITVESSGTVSCECFDGDTRTGDAHNLPKGGWGCSK